MSIFKSTLAINVAVDSTSFIDNVSTVVCIYLKGIESNSVATPHPLVCTTHASVPVCPPSTSIEYLIFFSSAVFFAISKSLLSIFGPHVIIVPEPSLNV